MIIRDAGAFDEPQITKLYNAFCEEFGEAPIAPPKISNGRLVVCIVDGSLVAYAYFRPMVYGGVDYTFGEHIYVKPEFRNMDIGSKLYMIFRRWARQEGKPIIISSSKKEHARWWSKGYRTLRFIMVKETKCTK